MPVRWSCLAIILAAQAHPLAAQFVYTPNSKAARDSTDANNSGWQALAS